ncbi:hypothetical protein VTO42DRAFT_6607 [Malbranchea cinnamomea]
MARHIYSQDLDLIADLIDYRLLAVRSLLAMLQYAFEAGLFPGVILQTRSWYRPDEMALRLLYFCTSQLGSSGTTTNNVAQICLETSPVSLEASLHEDSITLRALTMAFQDGSGASLSALSHIRGKCSAHIQFLLKPNGLRKKEKAFIQARLPHNAPREEELNFNWRDIVASVKDKRLWLFTLV